MTATRNASNRNAVSTVWLHDGTQVTFKHRDSLMGWHNALVRKGVNPFKDVARSMPGMPDSDRVA